MGPTEMTLDLLDRLREIIPDERELKYFCASRAFRPALYAVENGLPFVLKRTDKGFELTIVRNWGDL